MEIILNGHPRTLADLPDPSTVAALVAALTLKGDRIAIEHNGAIVSRANWTETAIHSGDKFEIVHFVGGGSSAPTTSLPELFVRRGGEA